MSFDASPGDYIRERDVRDWSRWRDRLERTPEGALWTILAPRRAGKTWALKALAGRDAHYVDLRYEPDGLSSPTSGCLLVDEPGDRLRRDPEGFLAQCLHLERRGVRVLSAMTPGEWARLKAADTRGQVLERDRLFLRPLTTAQAKALAERAPWAMHLLGLLPDDWRRNPFLLELTFEMAEEDERLRDDVPRLLATVVHEANGSRFDYVTQVFHDGLSDAQRDELRAVVRGRGGKRRSLLRECGLIADGPQIADPVLARHFRPPLVIHHISDLHFGPKTREAVDAKDRTPAGRRFAGAAGPATVRERYCEHVEALGDRGPHVLVVSGDLAETGTEEQYAGARRFIDRLRASVSARPHPDLRDDDPRVALVPGNHDVDWRETRGPAGARKRHLPFARAFDGYDRPPLEEPPEERRLARIAFPGVGVELVLLGSAELGGEHDEAHEKLVALIDAMAAKARDALEAHEEARWQALSRQVDRLDPGFVHQADLRRIQAAHDEMQPVRIAVLHHPVSPLPAAPEITRLGGLMNAGEVKSVLMRCGFVLVLHGHQHQGWFARETWPGVFDGDPSLHIAAAPTLGSRETDAPPGFNEIRIHREGAAHYEIELTRYVWRDRQWLADGDPVRFGFDA